MAYSYIEEVYTGDATFTIPFDYIKKEDVHLYINGIEKPFSDMTWVSDSIITVTSSLVENDVVKIARDSNVSTPVVDYQQTTVLDEVTLDLPVKQYMYLIQETRDIIDTYTSTGGTYTKAEIDALLAAYAQEGNHYTITELDAMMSGKLGLNDAYTRDYIDSLFVTKLDKSLSEVLNLLNGNITEDELYIDLSNRIDLIDADGTGLVQRVQDLTGLVNSNGVAIVTEGVTREDADSALAASITAVEARIDDKDAIVSAEIVARIDGDSALSSSIDTVITSVNDLTTAVQVQSESIDGIKGRYSVKIDNNGYVSGFGLISDYNDGTPVSEFMILADKFKIVTPGQNPVVPFSIGSVNGETVIGINGELIVDGSIRTDALSAQVLLIGDVGSLAFKEEVTDADITYIKGDTIDTGVIYSQDSKMLIDLDASIIRFNDSTNGILFGPGENGYMVSPGLGHLKLYGINEISLLSDNLDLYSTGDLDLVAENNLNISSGVATGTGNISFSNNDVMMWIMDTDKLYPWVNNSYSIGFSSRLLQNIYSYNYYDEGGLFQDKQDDLAVLAELKALPETVDKESGMEKIDIASLPTWYSNYNELKREFFRDNGNLVTEEDFDNWIKDDNGLKWKLRRNISRFNDLTSGGLRQLDKEVLEMFELLSSRITKLELCQNT